MPPGVASSLILNVLAFALVLIALSLITIRRQPGRNRRVVLMLLVMLELALVGEVAVLVALTGDPESSRFAIWILTNLAVSTYGLIAVMTFLTVIVLARLLRGPFVVLLRGAFILWVLLQWPLWISTLFTVGGGTPLQLEFDTNLAVSLYVVGLLLFIQAVTIGLAARHRASIASDVLVGAIVLGQAGNALILIFPPLRTPVLVCGLALVVAALVIYALVREPAAV